jgi:hypothetical protein
VLLKMSLNSGNKFCMYFVDLFAVSLVSWMWMIAMWFGESFIKLCRLGRAVLRDEAFHVIMFVSHALSVLIRMVGVGVARGGGGASIR